MIRQITLPITLSLLCVVTVPAHAAQTSTTIQPGAALTDALTASIAVAVDNRNAESSLFNTALQSNNEKLQIAAITGLGRIGGDSIIEQVAPYIVNSNPKIRRSVVFALGLSNSPKAAKYLWKQLNVEKSELVKQEIYLALASTGNGSDQTIVQFLTRFLDTSKKQQDLETQKSIYQSLAMIMVFKPNIAKEFGAMANGKKIDIKRLLDLFSEDNQLSYSVGFLLNRIPEVHNLIRIPQLQPLLSKITSVQNKKMLAKLIAKVVMSNHRANRRILSWLIEQSELTDVSLASESIRAMSQFTNIPQAKIQLGKLQASSNLVIAQTALRTLAESPLKGREIIALFKNQLKSENAGVVAEAMNGLITRQEQDDMTWALKIMSHSSRFVKVKFIQLIAAKDKDAFQNVIGRMAQDSDKIVADYATSIYAKSIYAKSNIEKSASAASTANKSRPIGDALNSAGQKILLKTTAGEITLLMNNQAPFTTDNFLLLVKSGFYDGSFFSRVIGNFVAQGGDPIGNGEGSSSLTIREEISYLPHVVGGVGMATAGKDTGDSQFFINTNRNLHLDRHYTIFAEVIEGLDVAFRLSQGDQIISASVVKP